MYIKTIYKNIFDLISRNSKNAYFFFFWSTFFGSLIAIITKVVINVSGLHATQVIAMRNILSLVFISYLIVTIVPKTYKTIEYKHYFIRSFFGTISMILWAFCVSGLPLNISTSLSFTVPIFSILLASLILKERLTTARLITALFGFVGVLIIMRPQLSHINFYYIVMIFNVVIWAYVNVFTKLLTNKSSPKTVLVWYLLFTAVISLIIALPTWQPIPLAAWPLLILLALSAILNTLCITTAYSFGQISGVQILDFLRLIFTSIFSFFLFGEHLDIHTVMGSAVIIFAIVASNLIDRRSSRK